MAFFAIGTQVHVCSQVFLRVLILQLLIAHNIFLLWYEVD